MTNNNSKYKKIADSLTGFLIGWNIAVLLFFLLIILVSILLSLINFKIMFGELSFYIEVCIVALVSIFIGYKLGKKSYKLLRQKSKITSSIVLVLSVLITLLIFPNGFQMTVV